MKTDKTEPAQFFTARQIHEQIVKAYPAPAWTVLEELRDSTGWAGRGQAADAFAFGTWPSRGFRVIGFEIKSFRGDWLRELKDPEKAEGLAKFADEWWLIANTDCAREEEIPMTWGWAKPTDKGLKVIKKPNPQMKAKEINRVFLMSIVRNIGKNFVHRDSVKDLIEAQVKEELERRGNSNDFDLKMVREELAETQKRISDFEAASGIKIGDRWDSNAGDLGSVVKAVMDSDLKRHLRHIEQATTECSKLVVLLNGLPLFKAMP